MRLPIMCRKCFISKFFSFNLHKYFFGSVFVSSVTL